MRLTLIWLAILLASCSKSSENNSSNSIQGIWSNKSIHLIFKDSLMFDQKLGKALVFKIKGDTVLCKSLKDDKYIPYYEIIALNKDTLYLKPFDNAFYELGPSVDFISFTRDKRELISEDCDFTSLNFVSHGCPKDCSEFTLEINYSGYYKLDEVNNIEKSQHNTQLSKHEKAFICYLINRVDFNNLQNFSNSSEPIFTFKITKNAKNYEIRISNIEDTPLEIVDLITYLINTPTLYK